MNFSVYTASASPMGIRIQLQLFQVKCVGAKSTPNVCTPNTSYGVNFHSTLSIFIHISPAGRTIDPLEDAIPHRHSLTPQTQEQKAYTHRHILRSVKFQERSNHKRCTLRSSTVAFPADVLCIAMRPESKGLTSSARYSGTVGSKRVSMTLCVAAT